MQEFLTAILQPILAEVEPTVIWQIGTRHREITSILERHAMADDVRLLRPLDAQQNDRLDAPDLAVIDGGPCWADVTAALDSITACCRQTGTSLPLILVTQTGWPYGRRDSYDDPAAIPIEHRLPSRQCGMHPDQPELVPDGLHRDRHNAIYENTLRNGVQTAVDDFIKTVGEPLEVHRIDGYHGLSILVPESLTATSAAAADLIRDLALAPPAGCIRALEAGRIDAEIRLESANAERIRGQAEQESRTRELQEQLARMTTGRQKDIERLTAVEEENHQLRRMVRRKKRHAGLLARVAHKIRDAVRREREDARARISSLLTEAAEHQQTHLDDLEQLRNLEREVEQNHDTIAQLESRLQRAESRQAARSKEHDPEIAALRGKLETARKTIRQLEAGGGATTSASSDTAVLEERRRRSRLANDVDTLLGLFEDLRAASRRLLFSKRWKIGHAIGELHRKARRRPQEELPNDEIEAVIQRFKDWYRERDQAGDDAETAAADSNSDDAGSTPSSAAKKHGGKALPAVGGAWRRTSDAAPVSIVVYSQGRLEELRRTLISLRRHTDCSRNPVSIIDDSGVPGHIDRIRELARGIDNLHITVQSQPIGRLASIRSALDTVSDRDVCLVTEGVAVTPSWLSGLVDCANRISNAGAVSPLTSAAPYYALTQKPGDTIDTTARKISLLSDRQSPTTALPDLDIVLLRRTLLDSVPLPDSTPDYRTAMARWFFEAHRREYRSVIADDTFAFVPARVAAAAASPPWIDLLDADEAGQLEEIENGADCPEIDVLEAYQNSEIQLVNPRTAVLLIDSTDTMVPATLVRLANDLVLRGIDVRALQIEETTWPDAEVERLFCPSMIDEYVIDVVPDHAHVFATSRQTARLAAQWREQRPTLHAYDLLLDLENRVFEDTEPPSADSLATLGLGLHMLATTEWSRKEVRHLTRGSEVSVRKIPFGIPLGEFFPEDTPSDGEHVIARLSGNAERDNVLLEALATLHEARGEFSIGLLGPLADTVSIQFPHTHHEATTPEQRRRLLNRAQLFIDVQSSRGIVASGLEAMACGCAVILTNCGGSAEYIRHGHNGILVEPGNSEDLTAALLELCSDPSLRDQIRARGQKTVLNYGRDRIASEIEYIIGTHHARRKSQVRRMSEDITCNIIVPIYNELEYVRLCLDSIVAHTDYPHRVYLIDDGSDEHTRAYLRRFVLDHENFHLIENETNLGFVQSCNKGMAATPSGDILLLNSDVIVTPDWLRKIVTCGYSDSDIGIVTPMSTRSSHLWIKLNPGDSIFSTASRIAELSEANYPDIVTPEGWCFFVRRACYEHLGDFDHVFGRGYCEESDYSMRALANGYRTVCADDTFVFHKGRVTFKGERGPRYTTNRKVFDRRWKPLYQKLYKAFLDEDPLEYIRRRYAADRHEHWLTRDTALPLQKKPLRAKLGKHKGVLQVLDESDLDKALDHYRQIAPARVDGRDGARVPQQVTFILSTLDKYGGVISVTQLVNDLIMHGIDAKIVVLNPKRFADDIFVLTEPIFFADSEALIEHFPPACNVVATLWVTMYYVARIMQRHPDLVPHYFIQDYEPMFYDEHEAEMRRHVEETYRLPARRFAKTHWIIDQVARHEADVAKVPPGLNLDIYYPRDTLPGDRPRLLLMMRPKTKRRGFDTILRLMPQLLERHPEVEIHAFGTPDEELQQHDIRFPFVNHGHLTAAELPAIYSQSDVYADLSSFQGFGRTGLEAMACATACLLTNSGGVSEYAIDGSNCLLVDPADDAAILDGLSRLISDPDLRARLVMGGLESIRPFDKTYSSLKTWELVSRGQYRVPAITSSKDHARTPVG